MKLRIPIPISGGLILSYKCSAQCRHCMYACSPEWSADWIKEEDLRQILKGLSGKIRPSPLGPNNIGLNHGLHFTGGEPFLNYELLCRAVELAREFRIPSTFVETNCFWCVDDRVTRERLRLLKMKGLKGILISVNPFFLEYVPFANTERAIRIGLEVFGRNVAIYQIGFWQRFKELGISGRMVLEDYLKLSGEEDFIRNVEFFATGRAPFVLKDLLRKFLPPLPAPDYFRVPCQPAFLRSWHNHFDNYGNYVPGYCGGISLGDCRELDKLVWEGLEVGEHPILEFLMKDDFAGLFQFAGKVGYRKNPEGYFSKCHLCVDIRRHLSARKEFKELRPDEFYSRLEETRG